MPVTIVSPCRSMGENMAEADEFDRVMQSVSEGSYRPSASAGMDTFPVREGGRETLYCWLPLWCCLTLL